MSITARRLLNALKPVPVERVERHNWDTPEGEDFLRQCLQAEKDGHDLDELGRELEIPNLRYAVRARERFLR